MSYTQTVPGAPVTPSTSTTFDLGNSWNQALVRELVSEKLVQEPKLAKEMTSARSFFNGQELIDSSFLLNNLKVGQKFRVNIKKDQNPFSLFKKTSITYDDIDSCHEQIELDCTVPCINTLPAIDTLEFKFDHEYAYGVRACDKNKDFYDIDFFTEQYAMSREAEQFGREVDLWNTVIKALIAAPATTVDAKLAATHSTHYWANVGTITQYGRSAITEAYWYAANAIAGSNFTAFITDEAAHELVKSVENPYNLNKTTQIVRTFEDWDVPGFMIDNAVKQILGGQIPVVVMKRSPWMTYSQTASGATTIASQFPLWSEDGTKQYVAILDPRVGYQFAKDGYHLNIQPYDCDKLVRGMIDTEYVGSGVTFPVYGMILEFTASSYV